MELAFVLSLEVGIKVFNLFFPFCQPLLALSSSSLIDFRDPRDFYASTKINLKSTALKMHSIKKKVKAVPYERSM